MKKWALFFFAIVSFFVAAVNSVLPPSGLKIVNPSSGFGNKKNPTLRVMGVQRGDWVRVYTDSSCQNQVGEGRARYQLVHITTSPLLPGDYLFYAKIIRKGVSSACSTVSARYRLILESNEESDESIPSALSLSMQEPSMSVGIDTTPTLRIKGVSAGDLVRLYTDKACTQMVGSLVARSAMADLTVSRPLSPGHYSFYADVVGTKQTIPCFASGVNYTVSPIVINHVADYSASDNGLDAFEKNRLWAERVAENSWSKLAINVVTMLTPMSFLATRPEKRTEAARALALNEYGLVDSIPTGESDSRIFQEGVFVETPLLHEWQRKTFSPLAGQFQAQVLEVGKYSAKIRFPLIPEASWYSLEKTNLKTMTDESLLILIYPPAPRRGTHIEYLLVGLRPAWEYTIQISAMARGVFFLDVGRAHTSVHFKTGGNPVSSRSF